MPIMRKPSRNAGVRLAVAALIAVAAAGCGGNDAGESQVTNATVRPTGEPKFRQALQECKTVSDADIAKAVGGSYANQHFYGAICRWTVSGPSGDVQVTENWFENGSLDAERAALDKLQYPYTQTTVQGWRALQARVPDDPGSCGVTAGAPDAGIVGWWVQFRSAGGDPCAAAISLMKQTLDLAR